MTAAVITIILALTFAVIATAPPRREQAASPIARTEHQAIVDAITVAYLEGRLPDNGTVYATTVRHPSGAWHADIISETDMAEQAAADAQAFLQEWSM